MYNFIQEKGLGLVCEKLVEDIELIADTLADLVESINFLLETLIRLGEGLGLEHSLDGFLNTSLSLELAALDLLLEGLDVSQFFLQLFDLAGDKGKLIGNLVH